MKTKAPLRFEYWKSVKDKQWYWRIRAGNGEPIAQSEGYKGKAGVIKAFRAIFRTDGIVEGPAFINKEFFDKNEGIAKKTKFCGKGCKKPKHYEGKLNRNFP